jgi:hypothetical protein
MTDESDRSNDVVRWYTRARKFPQLLGRTPDGTRLWGGPYTVTQAIGGGLVLVLGVKTMGLWGSFGLVGNALVLLSAAAGTVFFLGRIPLGARNPVAVLAGLARAVSAPTTGRLGGKAVRIRRPRQVRHRVVIATDQPIEAASAASQPAPAPLEESAGTVPTRRRTRLGDQPTTPPAVDQPPAERPNPAPALTGVQALLAARPAPTHGGTDR